jgi:L-erythro-3,5-diaminohexanoate dehydrogenase
VLEPAGVLPQAAHRLDPTGELRPGEIRIRVRTLNLDAASIRQLREKHADDADAVRAEVLEIVRTRGKMHNPVTGSGGMCIGVVEERHPEATSPVAVGEMVATLVSLTLTPLIITDALARWDGLSAQVPCDGYAVLFARTCLVAMPDDLPESLFLSLVDVCGAPALTRQVIEDRRRLGRGDRVLVMGAAGKSGALSLAAAGRTEADVIALVRDQAEAEAVRGAGLAETVVVADATDPLAVVEALRGAGGPADVVVVCVDVPGCEHAAILASRPGGTVIFFSMATSFSAAALGAEGMTADVTMLVGNGYFPGHAEFALDLIRTVPGVRSLLERGRPDVAGAIRQQPRLAPAQEPEQEPAEPLTSVTQRRYVSQENVHYAGQLVAGAFSVEAFGDAATELMIVEDGCEGLFAAYSAVKFLAPVQSGDVVETTASLVRRGTRSRHIEFELRVVARREDEQTSRRLDEPIIATTATGVVVVPPNQNGVRTP